ncbi:MAG: zf-HC2 domain-containing protein, partial [Nevskia sp.]|nr:zf-HC2 domain-containing protein [Nevskia sp.]
MDCQNLHQQLDDFLDGRLDSAAMAEFERHIAGCSPCRTQLTRELLLHLRLRHLPAAHPPAGFAD